MVAKVYLLFLCALVCCLGDGSVEEDEVRQDVHLLFIGTYFAPLYNDLFFLNYSVNYVNSRWDLFPRMQLRPEFRSVVKQQGIGSAIKEFIDGYLSGPNKALVLGASYSQQSQVIADVAKYYYLPQIGFSNTSPELSDKSTYPYYIRMAITNTILVEPIVRLLEKFNWKKIGLLVLDFSAYRALALELEAELIKRNVTSYKKEIYGSDATASIARLMNDDIRIFITIRDRPQEGLEKRLDCLINRLGAFGGKYLWIQVGFPETTVLHQEQACSDSERSVVMEGSIEFDTEVNDPSVVHPADIAGRSRNQSFVHFMSQYQNVTQNAQQTGIVGLDLRFDAVMAAALAINATLATENYTDQLQLADSPFKRQLFHNIRSLDFSGLSGRVKFDSRGDRASRIYIYQIKDLTRNLIAIYEPQTGETQCIKSLWFSGGSAPVDAPRLVVQASRMDTDGAATVVGLAAGSVCLAFAAMAANLWHRNSAFIRLSSPYVNSVIGLGCVLGDLACVVMAMNAHLETRVGLCWSQLICLATGYSCAFGGMLAKTWRVHRIFASKRPGMQAIKDWHLFAVIGAILLLDVAVFLAWGLADPIKLVARQLKDQEVVEDGILIRQHLTVCQYSNDWLWKGIIIGMKAVFLLFGIFFAWETRSIHVQALNDSKTIGVCVYNTTVMGLIGVVLDFALPIESVNLRQVMLSCCIIICSTITVMLVFGGKIVSILRDRNLRIADARAVLTGQRPATRQSRILASCGAIGAADEATTEAGASQNSSSC